MEEQWQAEEELQCGRATEAIGTLGWDLLPAHHWFLGHIPHQMLPQAGVTEWFPMYDV